MRFTKNDKNGTNNCKNGKVTPFSRQNAAEIGGSNKRDGKIEECLNAIFSESASKVEYQNEHNGKTLGALWSVFNGEKWKNTLDGTNTLSYNFS